jgi:hypothetical protein
VSLVDSGEFKNGWQGDILGVALWSELNIFIAVFVAMYCRGGWTGKGKENREDRLRSLSSAKIV